MTSPSMPPHFGTTPNVAQPGYTPYFSHITAHSGATLSYVSLSQIPHIHGPNFLTPACNVQMVGFAARLVTPSY